jgi:murein biosynthesis integral membrane protein MurJ
MSTGAGAGGRRHIVRQTGATGLAAAGSVASGLVLDVAIAATLGAGATSDAFFAAATIPLGIVAIVMVAANQALVPAIATWLTSREDRETRDLVAGVATWTAIGGFGLAILIALLAGPIVRITAPGFDDATADLAAGALRVMVFLAPLVMLSEVLRAHLNAHQRVVAPAAMNVVLNAVAAIVIVAATRPDARVIAAAYVAGGVAQLLYMSAMAARTGFRWRPTLMRGHPEIAATGRLMIRPMAGAGLNPLARIGEQMFVSFLPAGSLTIMRYGYRLVSAVGGAVLFRSVMVTLLPRLTKATAAGRTEQVRSLTSLGFRLMAVLSLCLAAVMAVLAEPGAIALFLRGRFTAADTALLGVTLAVYALSVPGSGLQRALLAPFYARLDTKTPLRNTFYGVVANLALIPVLLPLFGRTERAIIAVALAYSLAQYVNVAHAWERMHRALAITIDRAARTLATSLVAAAASAAVMLGMRAGLGLDDVQGRWSLLALIALTGVVGVGVFAGITAWFAAPDIRRLKRGGETPGAQTG